jgi:hypothetical protein
VISIARTADGTGWCLGVFVGKVAVAAGAFHYMLLNVFNQPRKFFDVSVAHTQDVERKPLGLSSTDARKCFKVTYKRIEGIHRVCV